MRPRSSSQAQQNLTFKVNAGLPNGLSTEVAVKIEEIENNSNPDNDGLYLNVSLTAGAALNELLPSLIEHFQAADPTTLGTPEAIAHFTAEGLKTLTAGSATVGDIGLSVGKNVSGTIELNFIKSHNLALQYARLTGSESTSLGVSDIPLGATGGTMSVGLEKGNGVNLAEWIGNSTITYVQTQCNGFKLAVEIGNTTSRSGVCKKRTTRTLRNLPSTWPSLSTMQQKSSRI